MAKVKCNVMLLVTGGAACGQGLVANRILSAIKADSELSSICKLHPMKVIGTEFDDTSYLSFDGELGPHVAEPESVKVEVFFCHDLEDGWYRADLPNGAAITRSHWYDLKSACLEKYSTFVGHVDFVWSKHNSENYANYCPEELRKPKTETITVNVVNNASEMLDKMAEMISEATLEAARFTPPKQETIQLRIDGITGRLYEHRKGWPTSDKCRIVTLLCAPTSDEAADPVGSPSQTENSPATWRVSTASHASGGFVSGIGVGAIKTDEKGDITDLETAKKFERLPGESNADYHKRFRDQMASQKLERDSRDKAYETLQVVAKVIPSQFHPHSRIQGSMLRGDYWVIFSDGALVPLYHFIYTAQKGEPEPVYYAERQPNQRIHADEPSKPIQEEGESDHDYSVRVCHWLRACEEAASPAKDAHITDRSKAAETFRNMSHECQALFYTNLMKFGAYPNGLVAGNSVQVITTEGSLLCGRVDKFQWVPTATIPAVAYYRKL